MSHHPTASSGRCLRAVLLLTLATRLLGAEPTDTAKTEKTSSAAAPAEKEAAKTTAFVQPYEPIKLGLTEDEGDDLFLDFTLSLMFPLFGTYASEAALPDDPPRGKFYYKHFALFFSGTVRGGQYIWSRPSSPVVAKRFNPQLFLRWWVPTPDGRESPHRFIDLVYGHESNGQSITNVERFNDQLEIYRRLEDEPDSQDAIDRAERSARDTISRGWDYLALHASWSWRAERHVALLKGREYLPVGIFQGTSEQSNDWELDGPTHPRRQYDGLTLQYTIFDNELIPKWSFLTGRTTFIYRTGLSHPGRYNTFELDLGITISRRPVSVWFRYGYNSNLTNYYRRANSIGGGVSIWSF